MYVAESERVVQTQRLFLLVFWGVGGVGGQTPHMGVEWAPLSTFYDEIPGVGPSQFPSQNQQGFQDISRVKKFSRIFGAGSIIL